MATFQLLRPAARNGTPSGTLYRSKGQAVAVRLCIVLLLLILTGQAVRLGVGGKPQWIPVIALIGAPVLLFLYRAAVSGVWAQDAGVWIVNVVGTRLIRWQDIERFSVGPLGLFPKTGIVELHDGTRFGIWSIQGPNPATRPRNTSAEKIIEALNRELARRTQTPASV